MNFSDPEISKVLNRFKEMNQQKPLPKIDSCPRCGQVGHTSANCPNQVPSIEEMQKGIEDRINKVISSPPDEWKTDNFGYFLPSKEGNKVIKEEKSWKDGEFCFNCGEFGHNAESCTQPTYYTLVHIFGQNLEQKGHKAIFERQALVDNVKNLCEGCENKANKEKEKLI